jgi:Xaa-Pro aminopeptidase
LYCNVKKLENSLRLSLEKSGVIISEYDDIYTDLSNLDDDRRVLMCENTSNIMIKNSINNKCKIIYKDNLVRLEKSKKSDSEIMNIKKSHIRDGVAMVKFLKWLDESIGKETITEMDIDEKLVEFRSMGEYYVGESFNSIVAYKEHGALMHYKATKETNYTLEPKGILLVDSGALYFDGTTDITRTIALGEVSNEVKKDFTLVLKGMMNLSKAKFLKGTIGSSLDILARQFLWEESIDYKCGTGHGVGYFLNVHEGPQGISMKLNDTVLEKGMILTNEPGAYREGSYGIRIENTLVVSDYKKSEFGEFYKFEDLTYCPIDIRLIDTSIMENSEINQINDYHKKVYDMLRAYLSEQEELWLKNMTRAL